MTRRSLRTLFVFLLLIESHHCLLPCIISFFFFYALFPPPQLIFFDRLPSLRPTVPIRYVVLSDILRSMILLHLERLMVRRVLLSSTSFRGWKKSFGSKKSLKKLGGYLRNLQNIHKKNESYEISLYLNKQLSVAEIILRKKIYLLYW